MMLSHFQLESHLTKYFQQKWASQQSQPAKTHENAFKIYIYIEHLLLRCFVFKWWLNGQIYFYFFMFLKKRGERERGKGSGVWPSMVTHTRNLSSAFNPSKCTLTAVNTHPEQWAAILQRPGSSWGIGALLKGLTSVVVLKVERALVIHSPHRQSLPDLGIEPATFGLQVQLSNH